jgi:transcriptional regulator with PAS, ATPase and Fis domain
MLKLDPANTGGTEDATHPFERIEGRKHLVTEFAEHGNVYEIWRIKVHASNLPGTNPPELEESLESPIKGVSLKTFIRMVDKNILETVLTNVAGNKSKAARLLGITRTALIEKCKRYNLVN